MPMLPIHFNFLTAVLGTDGAVALQKASDRSEDLGNALVPRSILAWLNAATKYDYEGSVPGVDNSYVEFAKSENGFTGSIDLHGERYSFKDASVFHLAATVATVLSVDDEILPTGIRNTEIEKLGKSIDLLAKSKLLSDAMAKEHDKDKCDIKDCKDCIPLEKNKPSHGGAASKGSAAGVITPAAPLPPTAVATQQPKTISKPPKLPGSAQVPKVVKPLTPLQPKVAKSMTINISKSEADRGCSMCGRAQFVENEFKGCVCLSALAKSSVVNMDEHGYIVKLGNDWDRDAVLTLFEAIGRIK